MDLNMNINRFKAHSFNNDDDNISATSRNSYEFHHSLNSAFNSDTECSGSVKVRDMIKLYNKQLKKDENTTINHKVKLKTTAAKRQSQHYLPTATKSSYCGLNNLTASTPKNNVKQFVDQMDDKSLINDQQQQRQPQQHLKNTCCKNCTACICCQNRSRKNSITNSINATNILLSPQHNNNENNNCCNHINANNDILVVENFNPPTSTTIDGSVTEFKDDLNKKQYSQVVLEKNQHHPNHRLLSTDSVEEANICQPIETSYQSKTTIAKTSNGVRIIIDIFFDQKEQSVVNATDVVGSRVETDIPQSRILNEFQQQSLAAKTIGTTTTSSASESFNQYQQP